MIIINGCGFIKYYWFIKVCRIIDTNVLVNMFTLKSPIIIVGQYGSI
jgi:hypothetical protein